jgi:hypothetical protein
MSDTILLELPEDVLLNALRRLSPSRRRWLFAVLENEDAISMQPVSATMLDSLSDVIAIGGDALVDSERLYDDACGA